MTGVTRGDIFGEGLTRSRNRMGSHESNHSANSRKGSAAETASLLSNADANV